MVTNENLVLNRYLVKSQGIQTLTVNMNTGQIPLPCTTHTPQSQSWEAIIYNTGDPNDQLHL